ncbi:DUF4232 domain-containing protein [Streptomyces sp. NPDC006516]|uniref:DUF4232 domain-containing protein n=1 Tax=Streptomyces sp. NPDC006516 TaxID=3154309 RepID=UPI0033B84173
MRNLHIRRAARTSVLGAAALVAALSLTACQSDSPAADDAAAGTSSQQPADGASAAPVSDKDADTGTDRGTSTGTDKATTGGSGASGSGSGTAKDSGSTGGQSGAKQQGNGDTAPVTLACDGGNSKVTITAVPRPVNHMLLTVTNTGSKACNAYYYPFLRFGEAQSAPQAYEESKPQAVVTLSPGESAYAGVMTSSADGSGTGGYSTKDLTVSFQGAAGSGSTGPTANVPLSKPVYVDSTLAVTYWQTDMDDALMY